MPRPMLMNDEKNSRQNILSAQPAVRNDRKAILDDPKDRERILRQKRSEGYIKFLTDLDTGNVDMKAQVVAIIEEIKKEFPLIEIPGDFIGYCAKCYLGKDYEVHMVDLSRTIIEHYQKNEPMPDGMEKARYIAMDGHYELIEVYTRCIRAIDADGNVSVIEC